MLVLQNFAKRFNDHLILEIDRQEFSTGIHWIKGENGSGKTTLFKTISGILPFEGEISFSDGLSLKKQPVAFRQLVNYSEAEPLYPGFLTAKDLIRFVGKIKNETIEKQNEYAGKLGVDSFFDKPCETYSSGMMKKLSLVMAFFGNPRLIILDEPLITLDEQARLSLLELIREKINKGNITFLISSHQNILPSDIQMKGEFQIKDKKLISI
jgi:ABC-2 type transport system ATP-binding protein